MAAVALGAVLATLGGFTALAGSGSGAASAEGDGGLVFRPPVDDYPYKAQALAGGIDPWRFQYGECVSFVAWKLNEAGGTSHAPWSFTNYNVTADGTGVFWGNGGHWADAAKALGYRVDGEPAVGAVAEWNGGNEAGPDGWHAGDLGHVAYVVAVNPDKSVVVEEYNGSATSRHRFSPPRTTRAPRYIHIADTGPAFVEPAVTADFNGDGLLDTARFVDVGGGDTQLVVTYGTMLPLDAPLPESAPPTVVWDSGPGHWQWTLLKPIALDLDGHGTFGIGVLASDGHLLPTGAKASGQTLTPAVFQKQADGSFKPKIAVGPTASKDDSGAGDWLDAQPAAQRQADGSESLVVVPVPNTPKAVM